MSFRYIPPGRVQPMGKFRSFVKKAPEFGVVSSTGRFFPGQKLYGIAFSYHSKDMSSTSNPLLWDEEMPCEVHIKELTVTSHHKVPDYWDESAEPKLSCDGYKLTDDKGREWHNQYPRASYGQLSDRSDRVFNEHLEKGTAEERFKTDATDPTSYVLITDTVSDIQKGITDLAKRCKELYRDDRHVQSEDYRWGKNKVDKLTKLLEVIQEKFTKYTNGKFVYAAKHSRYNFYQGKIADSKEAMWKDQYVPVSTKRALVEAVRKVKRHVVDPNKRLRDGFYTRFYSGHTTGEIHQGGYRFGGYTSKEGKLRYNYSRWYRYVYVYKKITNVAKLEKTSHYSIHDFASSAVAIADCAALTNLKRELINSHATGFELGVLFKGWPDTAERYVEYCSDIEHELYMDELHRKAESDWQKSERAYYGL